MGLGFGLGFGVVVRLLHRGEPRLDAREVVVLALVLLLPVLRLRARLVELHVEAAAPETWPREPTSPVFFDLPMK